MAADVPLSPLFLLGTLYPDVPESARIVVCEASGTLGAAGGAPVPHHRTEFYPSTPGPYLFDPRDMPPQETGKRYVARLLAFGFAAIVTQAEVAASRLVNGYLEGYKFDKDTGAVVVGSDRTIPWHGMGHRESGMIRRAQASLDGHVLMSPVMFDAQVYGTDNERWVFSSKHEAGSPIAATTVVVCRALMAWFPETEDDPS